MKRRYFMLSCVAGVAGVAAARYASSSEQSAIAKVLYKKLSYLKLDAQGVRQFAIDLAARGGISAARLRLVDAIGPLYTHTHLEGHNAVDTAVHHGEDRVTTLYLLSSDFFKRHAGQDRVVRYTGFYDPLIACGNPFARPAVGPNSA